MHLRQPLDSELGIVLSWSKGSRDARVIATPGRKKALNHRLQSYRASGPPCHTMPKEFLRARDDLLLPMHRAREKGRLNLSNPTRGWVISGAAQAPLLIVGFMDRQNGREE